MDKASQTIGEIATKSDNDAIILIVVLILGLVVVIPSVVIYLKARSAEAHLRHKEQMEREAEARKREEKLLDVVQGNTAAMVKLTTLLETNTQDCNDCRIEQNAINKDVLERIEAIHLDVVKIKERL